MADITNISEHPGYTHLRLLPSPDRDEAEEELLAFEQFQRDLLGDDENPRVAPADRPVEGIVACKSCQHVVDRRPLWKRWFGSLIPAKPEDLFCQATPLTQTVHPVTGEIAYVAGSLLTVESLQAYKEPLTSCSLVNFCGSCGKHQTKIHYGSL